MSYQLLRDLRDILQDQVLAQTVMRNPAVEVETDPDAFIRPRLFIGSLPPKRKQGQENEDFPFVLIRMTSGQDGEEYSNITTEIVCGIYTAENESAGVNDLQTIIDRIRGYLLSNRLVGGIFELELPLSWSTGSDQERAQPHPYYLGQVTANFRTIHQAIMHSLDDELDVYGSGYK